MIINFMMLDAFSAFSEHLNHLQLQIPMYIPPEFLDKVELKVKAIVICRLA